MLKNSLSGVPNCAYVPLIQISIIPEYDSVLLLRNWIFIWYLLV
jgi:hypothetical protein